MRVILLVEGETERKALPALVRRALSSHGAGNVGVDAVWHSGSGDVITKLATQVQRILNSPRSGEVAAIVCLLDAKGLPERFRAGSVAESCAVVRQHVAGSIADSRVRAHFAVHDVEAWILGDPTVLPSVVRDALPAGARTPERVNGEEPPAKLLGRLYRAKLRRDYRKIIDGSTLLQKADPAQVEATCPHFKALIDDLRSAIA